MRFRIGALAQVLDMLPKKWNLQEDTVLLLFGGQGLGMGDSLERSGIVNGSVVHLVLRLRAGGAGCWGGSARHGRAWSLAHTQYPILPLVSRTISQIPPRFSLVSWPLLWASVLRKMLRKPRVTHLP